jgi:hypothetical protein
MPLKIVMFYNQVAEGWTETYYVNTLQDPYSYIFSITNPQLQPLVTFRHSSVYIYAIRATTIGGIRQSYTYFYPGSAQLTGQPVGIAFGIPAPVGQLAWAGPSSEDLHCTLIDINNHKRPLYLRGLNQVDVIRNPNGQSAPSPYLAGGIKAMNTALMKLGWCIQYENRPPNNGLVWNQVMTVAPTAAGSPFSQLTLANAPVGIVPGQTQIVFQGIPTDYLPGFPRITIPVAAGGMAITVPWLFRANSTPYQPQKMKYTVVNNGYGQIIGTIPGEFSERKTGRAFGVPRGRSRAKVKAS